MKINTTKSLSSSMLTCYELKIGRCYRNVNYNSLVICTDEYSVVNLETGMLWEFALFDATQSCFIEVGAVVEIN